MAALAELQAPVHLLGVVGATENMISGAAVRPGDIVSSTRRHHLEINNTDAEAGSCWPTASLRATPRGAMPSSTSPPSPAAWVVALGAVYAGLMANDDALAERIVACGQRTGELVWRLPLHFRLRRNDQGTLRPDRQSHRTAARRRDHRRRVSCTTSPATSRGRTWTSPRSPMTAASRI